MWEVQPGIGSVESVGMGVGVGGAALPAGQRGHTLWKTPAAPRTILGGCSLEAAPWSEYRQARTKAGAHPRGSGLLRPFLSDASDLSEGHPRSVCRSSPICVSALCTNQSCVIPRKKQSAG